MVAIMVSTEPNSMSSHVRINRNDFFKGSCAPYTVQYIVYMYAVHYMYCTYTCT